MLKVRSLFFRRADEKNISVSYGVMRAYLCTGDTSWPSKINDDILKPMMTFCVDIVCHDKGEFWFRTVGNIYSFLNATNQTLHHRLGQCAFEGLEVVLKPILCAPNNFHILSLFQNFILRLFFGCTDIKTERCYYISTVFSGMMQLLKSFLDKHCVTDSRTLQRQKRMYSIPDMMNLLQSMTCHTDFFHGIIIHVANKYPHSTIEIEDELFHLLVRIFSKVICCIVKVSNSE